jgi:hypothetical protein
MVRPFAVLAWVAISLAPCVLRAQDPRNCSNGTMQGTYVMSASGSIVGVGPVGLIGLVTYDGQGNGLGTTTISVNGITSVLPPTAGTFTVSQDCTGTKTFGSGASATHFSFVITPDGKIITWLVTNPGWSLVGSAVRSRP